MVQLFALWSDYETGMRKITYSVLKFFYITRFINYNLSYNNEISNSFLKKSPLNLKYRKRGRKSYFVRFLKANKIRRENGTLRDKKMKKIPHLLKLYYGRTVTTSPLTLIFEVGIDTTGLTSLLPLTL